MNKRVRRLAVALLTVLMLLQAVSVGALAADEGDSTYTVRIYAGNAGTINGGAVTTITAKYGENVTFSPDWVQLPADSKYYVRGVRESGLDNNMVSNNVIHVTEDVDYVVAYGIKGELVSYTVNYVDAETGEVLAPAQTYYGNAGDKVVAAYLYIEGYQPQARNLTWTLTDSRNSVDFEYTRIVVPTPVPTPEPTATPEPEQEPADDNAAPADDNAAPADDNAAPADDNAAPADDNAAPADDNAAPADDNAAPADDNAAPADENAPEEEAAPEEEPEPEQEEIPEEEVPLDNGPAELIDLDEEDTPLGAAPEKAEEEKTELQKDREQKQTKFYVSTGVLAAALAVIVAAVILLLKKKKT